MTTTSKQPPEGYSESYPEPWLWEQHGETIAGTFKRFEQGMTKRYGPKPIAVLEVDGTERSLWLNTTVLAGKFKDELQKRPKHDLTVGERIVVTRLEEKTTRDGETTYRNFSVSFPDRPQLSTSDLFDLGEGQPEERPSDEAPSVAGQDDDIPF